MGTNGRETFLFVRRWLAHPLRVGALLPSSAALADLVARHAVRSPGEVIVELGAGTGTVSAALAAHGMQPRNLALIELDDAMRGRLRERFPGSLVIGGDAARPAELLPAGWHGRVTTIVSGIPVLQFPLESQRTFVRQCFALMAPEGRLLQYSYAPMPPLPGRELGLASWRLGVTFGNLPPAFLWAFTPADRVRAPHTTAQGGSA